MKGKKSGKKLEEALNALESDQKETTPSDKQDEVDGESVPDAGTEESSSPVKEPTPEPTYDEPALSEIIVESYEGEKEKGLFHGEGEAHFTGGHYYKGSFFEGLMHGKGMYVWSDGVSYEGEFTSNQVTGKGVYLWQDGSTYDGDVENGKRHGFGTFRFRTGKLSYTGDWFRGNKHGKGRMDYNAEGNSYYEGDWVMNIKHGWGTRQYPTGNIYEGMWYKGKRHGEGTMRWLDREQMYSGMWESGIQHGQGEHIWFLRRVQGTQYALRNRYEGEFVRGLRHGTGTFYYANGAKYEGDWRNNMKNGKGKFTFKNGRIYEGMFNKDHITEFPDFEMDPLNTPDLSGIRTRTPLPAENASVTSNESRNTVGPSFQLEIQHVLHDIEEGDRDEESKQVMFVLLRHMTTLKRIYNWYSSLGQEESPDNTFIMTRMQLWRFMKDCNFHMKGFTLMDLDRALAADHRRAEIHNPFDRILLREFLNNLVVLAYTMFKDEIHDTNDRILATSLSKLINECIIRDACKIRGNIYIEQRRAVSALVHMEQAYDVYKSVCTKRRHTPWEAALNMRHFLHMLNDFGLVGNELTASMIIHSLAADDPNVTDFDGSYNLELEITFLEFLEALIGCAQMSVTEKMIKYPGSTPRPSTRQSEDHQSAVPSPEPSQEAEEAAPATPQKSPPPSPKSSRKGPASSIGQNKEKGSKQSKNLESHKDGGGTALSIASGQSGSDDPKRAGAPSQATHASKKATSEAADTNRTDAQASLDPNAAATEAAESPAASAVPDVEPSEVGEDCQERISVVPPDAGTLLEESLDEATRQYNFWTHQVHFFFVRRFFPAAEKIEYLRRRVN